LSTFGFQCKQSLRFSFNKIDCKWFKLGVLFSLLTDHNWICESNPQVANTDGLKMLYWMSVIGPLWACVKQKSSLLNVSLRDKSSWFIVHMFPPDDESNENVMFFKLQLIKLPIVFERRFVEIPESICLKYLIYYNYLVLKLNKKGLLNWTNLFLDQLGCCIFILAHL